MKKFLHFLIWCWFIPVLALGNDFSPRDTPPALFSPKETISFLPQIPKVNVITGEYCEEECDLVIAGAEPLSINRFYNHFTGIWNRFYGHWCVNPETFMLFNFEKIGCHPFAAAGEENSAFFIYEKSAAGGYEIDAGKNKSFTNSSSLFSGRSHPLNTHVSYKKNHKVIKGSLLSPPEDFYWWEGAIKDGSGRERRFITDVKQWPQEGKRWPCNRRQHPCSGEIECTPILFEPPYQSKITEERLPNGNSIRYEYKDINESNTAFNKDLPTTYILKSISAYSRKGILLGSIEISYTDGYNFQRKPEVWIDRATFTGSDKRRADFFNRQRHANTRRNYWDTVLDRVEAAGKPVQHYAYRWDKAKEYFNAPFLYSVSQAEGRMFQTTYNLDTKKVIEQSAPVGPDGEMRPIARYSYAAEYTVVFDGENNKTLFRFNADKRITEIRKFDGNKLVNLERTAWDAKGNLLKRQIEDSSAKPLLIQAYQYDSNHNVILQKTGDGSSWDCIERTFTKDGFNSLKEEVDRKGKKTVYTYVPGTNLPASEIVYVHDQIVKRTFHFYDGDLNSVRIKTIIDDGSTKDPHDIKNATYRRIIEIDPKRTLPCLGLPEEIREKTIDASGREILLKKIRLAYHPSGKITREDHFDAHNILRYSLAKEYDAQERLIAATDPLGNRTTFSYDANFNLIAKNGPLSAAKLFYDQANRPIETKENGLSVRKKYDQASRVIATTDYCGNETGYTYDGLGRVIAIQHPDGGIERKEYDALGNAVKEIDPNGYETVKTCNFRGQPVSICHPDGSEEQFTYHPNSGALASHVDRNGMKTVYTYDLFDRCIKAQSPHKVTTAAYSSFNKLSETDAEGITTFYEYDYAGRKIAEKKADCLILYSYDELGRLSRTQKGNTINIQEYDLLDRVVEKRTEDIEGKIYFQEKYAYDANGNRTHLFTCEGVAETTYNSHNQPVQIITPDGQKTTITYTYDGTFKKATINPKGIQTIEIHDVCNRLKEIQVKNADGAFIQHREFEYDLAGNKTKAHEHVYEGTTFIKTLTTQWEHGPGGRIQRSIEAGIKETNYLYDSKGRLHAKIKPDDTQLIHAYDALGRFKTLKSSTGDIAYDFLYDKNDHVVEVKSLEGTTERIYDVYGNLIHEKLANGLTLSSTYNPEGERIQVGQAAYSYKGGRLSQIDYKGRTYAYKSRNLSGKVTQASTPIGIFSYYYDKALRPNGIATPYYSSSNYAFDPCGNLRAYTYADSLGTVNAVYEYDDLGQLVSENEHRYYYDSLHNRIQKDTVKHILNDLSQTVSDGKTTYDYDLNGNLIRAGDITFAYDSLDRLIAVHKKGMTYNYTYDPFNRRIAKTDGKKTVHYLWDGKNEIGSSEGELRILGEGLGAEIGAAVFIDVKGRTFVPIHDHRGNLVLLGGETYRYTAFGEELVLTPLSPWRFASKRVDPETNFVYFGRRYYSPALGKWITSDPKRFIDGPNLYTYLLNNPLLSIDPYGLWGESVGRFFGDLSHAAFRGVEWFGANLIPLPGLQNFVESVGRWGSGGEFRGTSNYRSDQNEVITVPGIKENNSRNTYHNGMWTRKAEAVQAGKHISQTRGGVQVDVLYQATNGFIMDIINCMFSKLGMMTDYNKMCAAYYNAGFRENPNLIYTAHAHSRGGINLMNTGKLIQKEKRDQIDVVTYGSATLIPDHYFGSAINNLSRLDLVPLTNPLAFIVGLCSNQINLRFLSPTTYCPYKEHGISEKTYADDIEKQGREFCLKDVLNE